MYYLLDCDIQYTMSIIRDYVVQYSLVVVKTPDIVS